MADADKHELVARLRDAPPKVVDEVLALAKRLIDDERGRQARLDTKASSLIAVVGLALTVASTFGGQLIKDALGTAGDFRVLAILPFVGALGFGTRAAFLAHEALKVKESATGMDEDTVFGPALLAHVKGMDASAEEKAAAAYKTSLAVHLWLMGRGNRQLQETKAAKIQEAQGSFFCFLVFLVGVFAVVVYAALATNGSRPAETASASGAGTGSADPERPGEVPRDPKGRGSERTVEVPAGSEKSSASTGPEVPACFAPDPACEEEVAGLRPSSWPALF